MRFYIWFAAEAKRGCFKRKHRPERKALSSDKIETRTRLTKLTKKQRSFSFSFLVVGEEKMLSTKKKKNFILVLAARSTRRITATCFLFPFHEWKVNFENNKHLDFEKKWNINIKRRLNSQPWKRLKTIFNSY